ncbi:hypothetical protein [Geothrix sp. PMB-07]|uniref:hypothetical protein n=1 Tax=Geothrix sp. PMB-07 TaxID=3068640 RepID=UPI002741597F|nr:hypothetical protein [Geothrix sp. PMB-07]WLT31425.1 hypothetical protein Q9293_17080 [Geothrix sp. PMB-07]
MNPRILTLALCLGSLLACGGGGGSTPAGPTTATRLTYTDPTTGAYQLRQNAALSSPTHLVLELWGPATDTGCGVSVAFTLGGTAGTWRNIKATDAAGTYVGNGTAFDLGSGTPILKATLSGATLSAAVAEKGLATPKPLNKALLQVAVELQTGTTPGTSITITPDPAKCRLLLPTGETAPILITASAISAQ